MNVFGSSVKLLLNSEAFRNIFETECKTLDCPAGIKLPETFLQVCLYPRPRFRSDLQRS